MIEALLCVDSKLACRIIEAGYKITAEQLEYIKKVCPDCTVYFNGHEIPICEVTANEVNDVQFASLRRADGETSVQFETYGLADPVLIIQQVA